MRPLTATEAPIHINKKLHPDLSSVGLYYIHKGFTIFGTQILIKKTVIQPPTGTS